MKTRYQHNCLKLAIAFGLIAVIGICFISCTMTGDRHIARGVCRHDARMADWLAQDAGLTTRYDRSWGVRQDGKPWYHVELEGLDTDGEFKRLYLMQPLDLYMEQW